MSIPFHVHNVNLSHFNMTKTKEVQTEIAKWDTTGNFDLCEPEVQGQRSQVRLGRSRASQNVSGRSVTYI